MLLIPSLPEEGNHPNFRENNRISNRPSQKIGIETPINAITMLMLSNRVFCFTAATTPSGTATTTARSMAQAVSLMVLGKRLNTSSDTGPRVL